MLNLFCRLATASTVALIAASASAAPWAEVGDRQLKEDIDLLRDTGLITGPITSWPIPWGSISRDLDAMDGTAASPFVRAAVRRVRARMDAALEEGTKVEVSADITNAPGVVRDFGSAARQDAEAQVRITHELDGASITYGIGWRKDQRGKNIHFDNLAGVVKVGNWALYGGTVENWWGPATETALLFSNNARPFPKIGFKRLSPEPFSMPVLRWLGPWRFEMFVGMLPEKREFSNQAISGMRLSFQPAKNLEIGLQRALQLCGKNRPCSIGTWAKAYIGIINADNTGTVNEPGNQIAGWDIRYSQITGPVAWNLYIETVAEDEDNVLIEQYSRTGGFAMQGGLGEDGAKWRFGVEYTDTLASKLFGGRKYIGSAYNQFIYTDGFTYQRKVIGASIGGDSKLLSLTGSITDTNNHRFYGAYRNALINGTRIPNNHVSLTREKMHILEAGVNWPSQVGDITLEARYYSDLPDTPNRKTGQAQVELRWVSTF